MPEPTHDPVAGQLIAGLSALGIDAADFPQQKLYSYLALLNRWNRAYNLTAVRDPDRQISHHVLDSLAILPHLHGQHCLDIGSGPGLPGLVLALARPDQHWVLLDSSAKKVRFLRQVQLELSIPNVEIVRARIESWRPAAGFDTIVVRALADLLQLYHWSAPLLATGGCLLAMKAVAAPRELAQLGSEPVTVQVHELAVPGITAPRTLVEIRRRAAAGA